MDRTWDEIVARHPGDPIDGVVVARVEGGLGVDIGVRAFLPKDEIDLRPVRVLGNVVGKRLRLAIVDVDPSSRRVVVSRRAVLERARQEARARTLPRLALGASVTGVVTDFAEHGTIVDLGGLDGLLSVADMGSACVDHPYEQFRIGERLALRIRTLDEATQTITLGWEPSDNVEDNLLERHRRIALNRQHLVVRVLRDLIEGADLAAETRRALLQDAGLIGVLSGVQPLYQLPVPPPAGARLPIGRLETDISFLALRVRLATGMAFALTLVPACPKRLVLANVTALNRLAECHRLLPSFSQFRDCWCGDRIQAGTAAHDAAKTACDAGQARAETLLGLLARRKAVPPPLPLATTVRHLGLITFCSDERAVDALERSLRDWDASLERFGRRDLTLYVCDDSEPEWSSRVRERLAKCDVRSGLRIRYHGFRDKRVALEHLIDEVRSSDKATRLVACGDLAEGRLDRALRGVLGARGPSTNRNWSMLILPKPCLQVDDDHLPEIYTVPLEWARARYEAAPDLPENAGPFVPEPFPIDLLGLYEAMPAGTLGSPVSSGSEDEDPERIVAVAGRRGKNADGNTDAPRLAMVQHYAAQATYEDLPRGMDSTKGPIFLPDVTADGRRICFLQPPIRDGDMAVTSVLAAQGAAPDRIRAAIHHREDAGSRAASPANLLYETTRSQLAWRLLRRLGSEMTPPVAPEALGWVVLQAARALPEGLSEPLFEERLSESIHYAASYIGDRLARGADRATTDVVTMAQRFGLDLEALLAGQAAREAELTRAAAVLGQELRPWLAETLEDYGWALVFWDEIAAVADSRVAMDDPPGVAGPS